MDLYFVVTDRSAAETTAIARAKPENLLGSYFYFKNKLLKDYFRKIGYVPKTFFLIPGHSVHLQVARI
jgi:hypothetical protein